MTYINPLDLKTIFVDVLSGSWFIFLVLALIFITYLAARFKMSNAILGIIIALFAVMFAYWISWFFALIIIVSGFVIFYIIARIIKN